MDQPKRIDIKEFRELGFLQEVNRLFFHPRGLALEVIVDLETGQESLGGVWDYRDDPEGIFFGDGSLPDPKKAKYVESLFQEKALIRQSRYGEVIQSILGGEE